MSKKVLAVIGGLLAVVAVTLTQLGGQAPPRPSTASPAPAPSLAGPGLANHCSPANYAMQCPLIGLPAPAPLGEQLLAPLHGVDFAWGGPRSCAAMRSLGAHFGAGYLSFDPSKNWNRGLVDTFHACGIATVSVWETTASRAARGFAAGASDARNAGSLAASLGNTHDAVDFAIDFDANGPEVLPYFKGAQSILHGRVNAYGGYRPLAYLHAHGAVGSLNWQTYAWSGGRWLPASIAPLEQYNNVARTYDLDRALAANYGQWPSPHAAPSPAPGWERRKNQAYRSYRRAGCKHPQDNARCAAAAAQIMLYQNKLWARHTPKRWVCFGPGTRHQPAALLHSEVCQVVRAQVAYAVGARNASRRALARCLRQGPVTFPTPCRNRRLFAGRVRYFNAKAGAVVRAYS